MNDRLNISFCIPTYNRITDLIEAVNSVLNLKGLENIDYEILVSDDSSDDLTKKYVFDLALSNKKIKYFKNQTKGQFNNLNNLVTHAQFTWIVFLHDDDKLNQDYLVNIFDVNIWKDISVNIIWTGRNYVDGKGNKIRTCYARNNKDNITVLKGKDFFEQMLSKHNYDYFGKVISPMVTGLMIKKTLILKSGSFDTRFEVNGDGLFLWRVFFLSDKIAYVNNPLIDYKLADDTERAKPSEKGIVFKEMKNLLIALLDFLKPFENYVEYTKKKKEYFASFYNNALNINGPILWTALRYTGSYLNRLTIQLGIFVESIFAVPLLFFKPSTWLVFFVSFLPQSILKFLYKIYLLSFIKAKNSVFQKFSKHHILLASLLFLFLVISFCYFTFSHLRPNQFLLIHDQSTPISSQHLSNYSFALLGDSGGLAFGIQSAIGLPDRILYSFLFNIGLSIKNVQFIIFSLYLYLFLFLSFLGLYKLKDYYSQSINDKHDFINVFIATLFYCLCFLSIMFMNSGNFWSLGFIFSYSLFPLVFYYVIKFIRQKTLPLKEVIFLSIVFTASAGKVIFFVPMLFSILVFVFTKLLIKKCLVLDFKKIFFVSVSFLLLFAYVLIPLFFESFYNIQNVTSNSLQDSTAGLISGGFLYQFLNYSSWVLYTPWGPRSSLSFYAYYLNNFYAAIFFSIYGVILFLLIKNKTFFKKTLPFLLILLMSIFFAKGPQPPFGNIFNYLVNHFPPLLVIRSPDNKFAIGICFAITVLILLILQFYKNKKILKYLRLYFLFIVIIVSYPLITGKAILGENIPGHSGSFSTEVFPEYKEIIDVLNQDKERSGVLIYPATNMPNLIHSGKIFIGKDILGIQSNKSFLYLTYPALTNTDLFKRLTDIYSNFNFRLINEINARYIIIRKDTYEDKYNIDPNGFKIALENSEISDKLINNQYLELYKIKDEYYKPKIYLANTSKDKRLSFSYISPVKYSLEIKNIRNIDQLVFLESYNKYWKIYPLKFETENNLDGFFSDLVYLYKKPIFDFGHKTIFGYANGWNIDTGDIINQYDNNYYKTNSDGSKNIKLLLYYKPQSFFYLGVAISCGVLSLFVIYLIYCFIKDKIKK